MSRGGVAPTDPCDGSAAAVAQGAAEAAARPSSDSNTFLLPSVKAVFCRPQDVCNTNSSSNSPTAARACLFPVSSAGDPECSTARVASVRQQDIPDVLKRMSEMQIFSSSAGNSKTGDEVDPRLREESPTAREADHSAVVFDVDALRAGFAAAKHAFPPHWRHCFAMKSCPLPIVTQEALDAGLGIEAASFVELYMALAHGCPADLVAFDSPAKTNEELKMALGRGTLVNANSLVELDRIDAIIKKQGGGTTARVGIRLNTLIGAGSIAEMSVSVSTSKFAVPTTPANILAVVDAFRKWPWLVALHTHVGSQGYSLAQLAQGIAALCRIADAIDGELGKGRVTLLDIGGGLPANYDSDDVSPAFSEYATALKHAAPSLFENTGRVVVTEFGRALVAKTAMTVSTVEYVRSNTCDETSAVEEGQATKTGVANVDTCSSSPDHQTLVTHVGADLFLRTSYCPGKYCHRLSMHSRDGTPLGGPSIRTDVAGPLCFQGDYVARDVSLPRATPGDLVVARDTGANTLSLFSRHCSRRSPAVYGYVKGADGSVCVRLVKEKESVRDVARFWGAW